MLPPGLAAGLAPGTVLSGKYRVERPIGTGGMGVVVAARHLDLNQNLAIKVLLPSAATSEEATTRFLREGRAAAQLTSPHVAKVHDTGRLQTGEPYLVMELLRGRDLREHLAEVRRVPFVQAIEWILQAAHALAEAHALNIIHRDVKPANLFLAETSAGPLIKVLDFGISKQLDSTEADLTNTSSTVGTPRYMAPEQMRSARFADARGDVWSLGIVLYELTTGQSPFHGDSVTALCFDVMERTPTPPSQLNPELPSAFDEVIERCLRKDPSDRFQSMGAFAAALRAVAPGVRSSGHFNASALQPAGPVSGTTPVAISTIDPATSSTRDPRTGPQPLPQPRTVTFPAAQPLFAELPPQETMRAWNTTSAGPRRVAKKPPRMALIAIGVGIGIAIATAAMMLITTRDPSLPVLDVGASAAVSSTPPTASPSMTPPESVVAPVDPPVLSSSPSSSSSALSSSPAPSVAAPPPPRPPRCKPPHTWDEKGHKIPKPGCY